MGGRRSIDDDGTQHAFAVLRGMVAVIPTGPVLGGLEFICLGRPGSDGTYRIVSCVSEYGRDGPGANIQSDRSCHPARCYSTGASHANGSMSRCFRGRCVLRFGEYRPNLLTVRCNAYLLALMEAYPLGSPVPGTGRSPVGNTSVHGHPDCMSGS